MAVYKATSWGRTRSPKNLAGSQGGTVTLVAETALVDGTAALNANIGYFTENQRYLHVMAQDKNTTDVAPQAVKVYGYCHAFLRWFPLSPGPTTAGTPAGAAASSVPAPTDEGVADGNDAFLPSGRIYRVYEIAGLDKVAFVGATTEAGTQTTVFAACSTF
tara:strand:+ start:298 stop:780 length:483 start_codon:yes stop_codon:yes gene_type:complete